MRAAAVAAGAAALALAAAAAAGPGPADYPGRVRPLLEARCFGCHGPAVQRNGLRLDLRERLLRGGVSGPAVVPGRSGESELVRRLLDRDPKRRMPPGRSLAPAEIALLRRWIDDGARFGAGAAASEAGHWSFRPITRPAPPAVRTRGWALNPIDAFVLARLERQGMRPSPPASRVTLIRRASLDLVGLPPPPAEVDAFLADRRPGAYERVVDRLLASPHYGERWGRHWLDLARYADSNGYTIDSPRSIWPYRDWVIQALNADMPFDRFTCEQLAGDLLPGATLGQRIATGFHRNTMINEEGGTDPEQFRVEAVVDRVNTTATVWLGLTLACAQCHDHKHDPLTQQEYYRFLAFFNSADEPVLPLPTPAQAAEQETLQARLRDPALKAAGETRLKALEKEIASTLVMRERGERRATHVHLRGDFLRRGSQVEPGVPGVLPPLPSPGKQPHRLDLARWLTDRRNPLTARVQVNRIWARCFGTGLVETDEDFGTQGSRPTHPALLDWLAASFAAPARGEGTAARGWDCGWSMKRLLRLIVSSATYRQASRARPELRALDPRNLLLARQNRVRLEAEGIRDSALAASGLLSRKIGGPSVFPPQPGDLDLFTQNRKNWKTSEGEDRYRRGIYTFLWRTSPHPMQTAFDAPNGTLTCTRRNRSNTPVGALMLANDASLLEMAGALAARALREAPPSDFARVRHAFRLCLGRMPAPREAARLLRYHEAQLRSFSRAPAAARSAAPPGALEPDAPRLAAWTAVARVLLNLDEFITRE